MKKRLMAMLLAMAIVLSMLPVTVLAGDSTPAATQHTDAEHVCHHCAAGTTVTWTPWDGTAAGFTPVADGQVAHYVLSAGATLDNTVSLNAGTYVLCLNRQTLLVASGKSFFKLSGTAKLILEDCTAEGTPFEEGYIAGTLKGATASAIDMTTTAATALEVYNVIFENNTLGNATTYGGAINIIGTSTVGGTLKVDGALFKGNTAKYGAAISLKGFAVSAELKNVMITGNTAYGTGSIYMESSKQLTLENTTITGNTSTTTNADFTAGLYVTGSNTKVLLSGKVVIDGNTTGTNSKCRNVSLYHANSKLTAAGLTEGSQIQFGSKVNGSNPLTSSLVLQNQTTWNCGWLTFDKDSVSATDTNNDGKMDTLQKGHYHGNQLYTALTADNQNAMTDGGFYYLAGDLKLSGEKMVKNGKTLNLCLNGHTLSGNGSNRLFATSTNATTTCKIVIEDCWAYTDAQGNYYAGKLTGGNDTGTTGGGAILVRKLGAVELHDGIITGNKSVTGGGAICMLSGGTSLRMLGGEISNNEAIKNGTYKIGGAVYAGENADIKIEGGAISGNKGSKGGAFCLSNAALTVSGGTIKENIATDIGGAVYGKPATIKVTGGSFVKNEAANAGGAIYQETGTLEAENATFEENNGGKEGGAVYLAAVDAVLTNVTITGNKANYASALYMRAASDVTLDSCTITGNTAVKGCGAIYTPNVANKLTLKGNVQIKDNKAGENQQNVYLRHADGEQPVLQVENLADTAVIGVTVEKNRINANVQQVAICDANADCAGRFVSDVTPYAFGQKDTQIYIKNGHDHCACGSKTCNAHSAMELLPWDSETSLPTGGNWYLTKPVTLNNNVSLANTTLNLCLNGQTVKIEKQALGGNRIFNIGSNVTLNLTDCADTPGKLIGGKDAAVIFANPCDNAVFNMYGGEITGNTTNTAGAGVRVQSKGVFNMYGGKITGNKVEGYLKDDGTPNNTILGGAGVAVLNAVSTFNMYGGEISGNEVKSLTYKKDGKDTTVGGIGAAVYTQYGDVNIYGGTISGNTADTSGAAIYVLEAKLNMSKALLQDNVSGAEGGAVYLAAADAVLTNVTITGNKATYASALYMRAASELTLDSCTITGNTATKGCGAIYTPNVANKLTLTGNVQIKDNKAGDELQNVYLRHADGEQPMLQVENLADTAVIGVTVEDARLSANVLQVAVRNANEDCVSCFVSDSPMFSFGQKDTQIYIKDGHNHHICGKAECQEHAACEMLPWRNAKKLPTSGNWFLATDVTLSTNVSLANTTLNLCLNGHTVKVEKEELSGNRIFSIGSNATLNLTDCAKEQGKLTGGKDAAVIFANPCENAVFNMYGGEITGNTTNTAGAGVRVQSKGVFNMYGGKITGNKVEGYLKDDGAPNNTILGGAGVAVLNAVSTFNMYGGEISGNEVKSLTYKKDGKDTTVGGIGAAVYTQYGDVNIYGGTISGNTADTSGAAIYVMGAKLNMSNALLQDNVSGTEGGAVYLAAAKAELTNVTITGNKATYASALYMRAASDVTLDSCTITGNTATKGCGAIYTPNVANKLTLKGNVQIKDNKAGENQQNVYLRHADGEQPMLQAVGLAKTAVIGVTVEDKRLSANVLQVATRNEKEDCVACFVSDNPAYSFAQKGTQILIKLGHNHCVCGDENCNKHTQLELLPWTTATSLPTGGNWFLATDVTLKNNVILADTTLNLCLNGHTVKVEKDDLVGARIFKIESNATLSLTDCAETAGKLTGGKSSAIMFANDAENSVLNLYGGEITGNSSIEAGGGIVQQGKTTVNIYGGKIHGNTVQAIVKVDADNKPILDKDGNQQVTSKISGGAGIIVYSDDAVLNMYGGEISGNEAKTVVYTVDGKQVSAGGDAGGLYVRGTFNMYGGKICNNTSGRNGAGIKITGEKTVFTMTGGEISGNIANVAGGGVMAESKATLNLENGKITGNKTVTNSGAGVYISVGCTMNMTGGEISGNASGKSGGGVMFAHSTGNLKGGTISKNTATAGNGGGMDILGEKAKVTLDGVTITRNSAKHGGGLILEGKSHLHLKSGKITNNRVTIAGGGVYVSINCTATMEGGSISYNSSEKNSGGMHVLAAKVKMSNVTVQGNVALQGNGGGIYITRINQVVNGVKTWILSTVTMNGCYVANNEAKHGAGILMEGENDTLNINGGTFKNNIAQGDGGAIYASNKTVFNLKNAKIVENEAVKSGGGLRVGYYAKVEVEGATFTKNTAGDIGGGIYHYNATGTYKNITVTDNTAKNLGGGICTRGNWPTYAELQAEASLEGCTISGNSATQGGGVAGKGFVNMYMDGCKIEKNSGKTGAGGFSDMGSEVRLTNCSLTQNSATGNGGGFYTTSLLIIDNCQITGNTADGNGGGIGAGKCASTDLFLRDTGIQMSNTEVSGNLAGGSGGGMYMPRGCAATLTDVKVTGNTAKAGVGGFLAGYDLTAKNLTVTGNEGTEYAVWITEANYDGHSYQVGHREFSGLVTIADNKGGDLYMAEGAVMTIPGVGMAEGSKIVVTLASGLITQRVFGQYNYEGGNLTYTLTPGTLSITNPELPAAEPEAPTEDTENASQNVMLYVGVAAFAIVIVAAAVILILLGKKKKKAVETADTTQE